MEVLEGRIIRLPRVHISAKRLPDKKPSRQVRIFKLAGRSPAPASPAPLLKQVQYAHQTYLNNSSREQK